MPSRNLSDLDTELEMRWHAVYDDYRALAPGRDLIVTCTHRSVEEQQQLYALGRTQPGQRVTNVDGVTQKSKHNLRPARALDFAVVIASKVSWDHQDYAPVGAIATRHGLAWGGNWHTLKDYPHLEMEP